MFVFLNTALSTFLFSQVWVCSFWDITTVMWVIIQGHKGHSNRLSERRLFWGAPPVDKQNMCPPGQGGKNNLEFLQHFGGILFREVGKSPPIALPTVLASLLFSWLANCCQTRAFLQNFHSEKWLLQVIAFWVLCTLWLNSDCPLSRLCLPRLIWFLSLM